MWQVELNLIPIKGLFCKACLFFFFCATFCEFKLIWAIAWELEQLGTLLAKRGTAAFYEWEWAHLITSMYNNVHQNLEVVFANFSADNSLEELKQSDQFSRGDCSKIWECQKVLLIYFYLTHFKIK